MTGVLAIDDDRAPVPDIALSAEVPAPRPPDGAALDPALTGARVRAALSEAAPVLADAARMLDATGRSGLSREDGAQAPDDDRAAGRLDRLHHDLFGS